MKDNDGVKKFKDKFKFNLDLLKSDDQIIHYEKVADYDPFVISLRPVEYIRNENHKIIVKEFLIKIHVEDPKKLKVEFNGEPSFIPNPPNKKGFDFEIVIPIKIAKDHEKLSDHVVECSLKPVTRDNKHFIFFSGCLGDVTVNKHDKNKILTPGLGTICGIGVG